MQNIADLYFGLRRNTGSLCNVLNPALRRKGPSVKFLLEIHQEMHLDFSLYMEWQKKFSQEKQHLSADVKDSLKECPNTVIPLRSFSLNHKGKSSGEN